MLEIEARYFTPRHSVTATAARVGLRRETLSRIVHGRQAPGYGKGQSAERIAATLGWKGDLEALFSEVDGHA